ncbi:cytochrome P450 [Mycobacterium sp. MOTT36Y]|uniref:cytochrome P450 n=1 Tax=Mycobacterium sp. MOTT36Y TaxID=1168287 RepID=UPI00025D5AD0|nr:cytochrome P450 [Mycobacterium sp. MOTT36Y]AFJ34682.1 cytochrome P450 [Mycobacterium sp. MOTT36Y]
MTDTANSDAELASVLTETEIAALLPDFDFFDKEHADRSVQILGYARRHCPVPHTSANGGYHIVTRYDDVRRVLTDSETFSSTEYTNISGNGGVPLPPLDTDPPLQHGFRQLLNPFFHPKRLAASDERVREIARCAMDTWVGSGRCEAMQDFAGPFVTNVLASVIFEDDDGELFRNAAECNERFITGDTQGVLDFYQLMVQFVEKRAASSQPGAIVDAVTTGTVLGRPLTDAERIGVVQVLFVGGLDTTKVAIGDIVLQLATDPSFEELVREPGWERTILDEFLRYTSPVNAMGRIVTRDVELNGTQLHAGDRVLVHFGSANRDADVFDHADELDYTRERNPHVGFGMGVHRCIGMHLARQQIRIAIDTLLERVTNLRLAPGAEIARRSGMSRVLYALPIEFDIR